MVEPFYDIFRVLYTIYMESFENSNTTSCKSVMLFFFFVVVVGVVVAVAAVAVALDVTVVVVVVVVALLFFHEVRGEAGTDTPLFVTDPISLPSPPPVSTHTSPIPSYHSPLPSHSNDCVYLPGRYHH